MPRSSLPRRLLALATGNRPARIYLAVVAVSAVAVHFLPDGFLVLDPMILTAPLSFLAMVLPFGPGSGGSTAAAGLTAGVLWTVWLGLCALVNAAAVGAIATRSPAAERIPSPAPSATGRRLKDLLSPAFDNWAARGYLALVGAALGFFLWAVYLSPDPGFAAIWPVMATAPLGFLALVVSIPAEFSAVAWLSPPLFSVVVALAGLVNAVLLGRLTHRLGTAARPAS
ncbi:SCO4225 family membrane protein [Streptomyces sp. CRN 30]|uniref:SCO4225 family membrane protein n=1 Tax=Streptomyces sp. CRN 30 TaxID=3075613 RepID=UPI002A818C23|nr:hypothetical protein [Streptomyces sp. CRN 30]